MRHGLVMVVAGLAVAAVGCGSPVRATAPVGAGARAASMRQALEEIRKRFGAPAVAAAVYENGSLKEAAVVGERSIDKRDPVQPGDRFHVGSVAKPMTALMLFRLVDQGKVRGNATLSELLPGMAMRDEYKRVTLDQLLGFRAGIQPYTLIGPKRTPILFQLQGTPEEQRKKFVAHVLQEPPVAPPGTQRVYSNAGFAVAATIASEATGKGWQALMRELVFEPLGMRSAGFDLPSEVAGYMPTPNGLRPAQRRSGHALEPAGNVHCAIEDFARFGDELVRIANGRSELLSAANQRRYAETMGVTDGFMPFGSGGAFTAALGVWPSKGLAVAAATNVGFRDEVCETILHAVSGCPSPSGSGSSSTRLRREF